MTGRGSAVLLAGLVGALAAGCGGSSEPPGAPPPPSHPSPWTWLLGAWSVLALAAWGYVKGWGGLR